MLALILYVVRPILQDCNCVHKTQAWLLLLAITWSKPSCFLERAGVGLLDGISALRIVILR